MRDLLLVSFTAQAMVFPLILYHFHQFPLYFLPANLLASIVASLLIPILLLVAIVPESEILMILVQLCEFGLGILLKWVDWIAQLPGQDVSIRIDLVELSVLYTCILTGILYAHYPRSFWLWLLSLLLIVLFLIKGHKTHHCKTSIHKVCYQSSKYNHVEYLVGGRRLFKAAVKNTPPNYERGMKLYFDEFVDHKSKLPMQIKPIYHHSWDSLPARLQFHSKTNHHELNIWRIITSEHDPSGI